MSLVTFAIPLAPTSRCDYWDYAMENLKVTLNSINKQTNRSFNVILAKTKDEGALPAFCYETGIVVVEVEDSGEWSADKDNKTLAMLKVHYEFKNKYFLRTDWDDIYNINLVDWVANNENSNGFMITKGYFYKPIERVVKQLDNFNMQCGSCHLVNYSEDELLNGVKHPKKFTFHHQHIHEYRHAIGRPLSSVPFRAALYAVTGKNISTPKHQRILKNATWSSITEEIKKDFALEEIHND